MRISTNHPAPPIELSRRVAGSPPLDFDPPYGGATSAQPESGARRESNRGEGVDRDQEGAGCEQPARIDWRREATSSRLASWAWDSGHVIEIASRRVTRSGDATRSQGRPMRSSSPPRTPKRSRSMTPPSLRMQARKATRSRTQDHAKAERQICSEARLASSRDCERKLTRYLTRAQKIVNAVSTKKTNTIAIALSNLRALRSLSLFALLRRPLLTGRRSRS
jgi:hypothetical protein